MATLSGVRLSRFYNYEQDLYIPAPTGGWNPAANPWELPDSQAPQLDNFIIAPGKIRMRSPFTQIAALTGPYLPMGAVMGDKASGGSAGWLTLSQKTFSATAAVDPWLAPLVQSTAAQLASGGTTLTQVNLDSIGSTTTVVVTADKIPGPRWINFDGLLYGIGYDSTLANVTDTNATYTTKATSLLTLPDIAAAATAPTILANAPHGAFDLKGYLSRIWMLGGVDTPGGLTVHEPTTLYYTNPGVSGVGSATADWKDPVSGLVNKIRMDNNHQDFAVGLAVVPNALVIFRHSSVWILRGTTSATFQLQPISKDVGCLDARSIVELNGAVYFMSHRGLMVTDGVSLRNVSGTVAEQLAQALQYHQGAQRGTTRSTYITCTPTSGGHIVVSLCVTSGSNGNIQATWSGMFDPSTETWTRLTSTIWSNDSSFSSPLPPMLVSRDERQQLYSVGDSVVLQLECPNSTVQGGPSFLHQAVGKQGLFDAAIGGGRLAIPAVWQTITLPIIGASRRKLGQAKRYFVDYVFGRRTGSTSVGWNIVLNDLQGTAIEPANDVSQGTVPFGTGVLALPAKPSIQRADYDLTSEVGDCQFVVSWAQTSASGETDTVAEIYGIGLEFQHTRDAR